MATASQIIAFALQQKGKPYVFGASGPDTFDCSGFIHYVLKNCGIPNTRTSVAGYWSQATLFDKISYPIPGHLVFFENTYQPGPSHMGILINEKEFIHASDSTTGVIVSQVGSSYWNKYFLGYGKLKAVSVEPSSRFIDVPQSHWAYPAVEHLASNGLMNGYGDGFFGVDDGMTREQIAAVVYRIIKPADSSYNPFNDIGASPFQKEIHALTASGVFSVGADGKFNPTRIATRAEVATIITKAWGFKKKAEYEFLDMNGHWANDHVKALYSNGIVSGSGDRMFHPDDVSTRGACASMFYKAIFVNPNFWPQPI